MELYTVSELNTKKNFQVIFFLTLGRVLAGFGWTLLFRNALLFQALIFSIPRRQLRIRHVKFGGG